MPDIKRKFICFDPVKSHNKSWEIEWNAATGIATTRWSAVGNKELSNQKPMTQAKVDKLIREKIDKGYRELDVAKITVTPNGNALVAPTDSRTAAFISFFAKEAGVNIASYLDVPLQSISLSALDRAEKLITQASGIVDANGGLTDKRVYDLAIEYFYNIPTKIPRAKGKILPPAVLEAFTADKFVAQSDRLQQLRVAVQNEIDGHAPISAPAANKYGETEFEWVDPASDEYQKLVQELRHKGALYGIKNIYRVSIPTERSAFDRVAGGIGNISRKYHGSYAYNFAHIFKTGLILPKSYTHGWRFGPGIYSADNPRAKNYCHPAKNGTNVILVLDVALGKEKHLKGINSSIRTAPAGYHSVRGIESHSGHDEWIVYTPDQVTIRYAVEWS